MKPLIFDIVHGSFVDGPGIRTVVFFKGCPLNCEWCHNPEGIGFSADELLHEERCIGCGECAGGCKQNARETKGISASPVAKKSFLKGMK